jgi:hypothetical protein
MKRNPSRDRENDTPNSHQKQTPDEATNYKQRRERKINGQLRVRLHCLGALDDEAFSDPAITRFLARVVCEFRPELLGILKKKQMVESSLEDIAIAQFLGAQPSEEQGRIAPIPCRFPSLPGISAFANLELQGSSAARHLSLSFACLLHDNAAELRKALDKMPICDRKVLLADGLAIALAEVDRLAGDPGYEGFEAGTAPMPWPIEYANQTRRDYYTHALGCDPKG